jgi:hypothetical protein
MLSMLEWRLVGRGLDNPQILARDGQAGLLAINNVASTKRPDEWRLTGPSYRLGPPRPWLNVGLTLAATRIAVRRAMNDPSEVDAGCRRPGACDHLHGSCGCRLDRSAISLLGAARRAAAVRSRCVGKAAVQGASGATRFRRRSRSLAPGCVASFSCVLAIESSSCAS